MSATKQLEFRGIRLEQLIDFFKELDGIQRTVQFPIIIKGRNWECSILKEENINFTSTFVVNAVHMLLKAESEEILEDLLKKYRMKTTRVGG